MENENKEKSWVDRFIESCRESIVEKRKDDKEAFLIVVAQVDGAIGAGVMGRGADVIPGLCMAMKTDSGFESLILTAAQVYVGAELSAASEK